MLIFSAMTDDPRFAEPIPNVTVALGRDASLPCVVENLGKYKVWYFCCYVYMYIFTDVYRSRSRLHESFVEY